MIRPTGFQLQQDGNTVAVQFDGKYVIGVPVLMLDDTWLKRQADDLEVAEERVTAMKKKHLESNLLVPSFGTPKPAFGGGNDLA